MLTMAELVVILAVIAGCFLAGALRSRYRLGSRQETVRLFESSRSNSHRG
jgi:hypothetical protein